MKPGSEEWPVLDDDVAAAYADLMNRVDILRLRLERLRRHAQELAKAAGLKQDEY